MTARPIAIVQSAPVFMNLDASLERACGLIHEAAGEGAELVVFPETWLPGYPVWLDYTPQAGLWNHAPAAELYRALRDNAPELPGPTLDLLIEAARDADTCLVMGLNERDGGTLYNTMLFVAGEASAIHRKLVPTYTERLLWGQGDGSTLTVIDTQVGRLGGLICWEHWMPLARAAMHARREQIHIAQWPAVHELHQIASRHYAFEGQCFVIAAGTLLTWEQALAGFDTLGERYGEARELLEQMQVPEDGRLLGGGSSVIAPDGSYLLEPDEETDGILYAEIDPALIDRGHLTMYSDGHYSRPDVFELTVDEAPRRNVRFVRERD